MEPLERIPSMMRLVPTTGAVILVTFPEIPKYWTDPTEPNGQQTSARIAEAQKTLDRLSSYWLPAWEELGDAPLIIVEHVVHEGDLVSLAGRVYGHAEIPDGHLCITSVLIAYDGRNYRWARTVSRWYRIRPAPDRNDMH
jgi:hypothetical protein